MNSSSALDWRNTRCRAAGYGMRQRLVQNMQRSLHDHVILSIRQVLTRGATRMATKTPDSAADANNG
ncbi:hypothetical protein NMYAN_40073 [Nitrosomonas nitrosa]|uniref:Uncharacterized protein n=1 Tax=Nitrosomonas nitrosa TaxID=52442 RepID=A0A8H8Z1Q3_9PROT|nr:hypothetical protein [Nitrosomonas nitrosa]CAE6512158.1 hypothetical protein NMYAN_40073 [Nitrosomonas nitrosa]